MLCWGRSAHAWQLSIDFQRPYHKSYSASHHTTCKSERRFQFSALPFRPPAKLNSAHRLPRSLRDTYHGFRRTDRIYCASTMPPVRPDTDASGVNSATRINIGDVLGACIAAAKRSCGAIRSVQTAREAGNSISESYKDELDPRSALTIADTKAQNAIVTPLKHQFPTIDIIGEEDDDHDGDDDGGGDDPQGDEEPGLPLTEEVELEIPDHLRSVKPEDVCIFCDPLDGTLEFVKGRLDAVQTLIGICVKGEPVAGVIGRPFVRGMPIYGVVGAGVANLPENVGGRGDRYGSWLASSASSVDKTIADAIDVIAPSKVLPFGGAGNKMLQVATGAVDVSILNLITSLWDTAATQAIIVANGGTVTDLFGNPIVHTAGGRVKNICGVLASSRQLVTHDKLNRDHKSICKQLRESMVLDDLLGYTGLKGSGKPQATDIARDIDGFPLTTEWFSEFLNAKVSSFTANEESAVRYLMSDACRITLKYEESDQSYGGRRPQSVFMKRIVMKHLEHVKLKARTAPAKLTRDVTSYQVEASFLASRACQELSASGTRIVKPYHVDVRPAPNGESPIESKFMLVLEDFNRVDGWIQCGLLEQGKMRATLCTLASMHAYFWNYTDDDGYNKVADAVWDQGTYWTPKRQAPDSFTKIPGCWKTLRKSFEEPLKAYGLTDGATINLENFGNKLAEISVDCAESVHAVGLDRSHPHRTLIHGDAKAANFFFREIRTASQDATPLGVGTQQWDVGMIDFQWCGWGHPATDIAYLIAASASPDLLSHDGTAELALLKTYHDALARSLVKHGKAANVEEAGKLMPMEDLRTFYNDAIIDLARLVVSYHWDRIRASPEVLRSRVDQLGSNSYNKNVECAMWLIARTASLLSEREMQQ